MQLDILKKHQNESVEEESKRIRKKIERVKDIFSIINSLGEEKQKIAEKLFNMQQNFIRKLD